MLTDIIKIGNQSKKYTTREEERERERERERENSIYEASSRVNGQCSEQIRMEIQICIAIRRHIMATEPKRMKWQDDARTYLNTHT